MKAIYKTADEKKKQASKLFTQYNLSKDENIIKKCVELNPIEENLIYEYLCKQKTITIDLKINFYDALSKEKLSQLKIKKTMNNKDVFYYIIEYFENVKLQFINKTTGKIQLYEDDNENDLDNVEEEENNNKNNNNNNIKEKTIKNIEEKDIEMKEEIDIKNIFKIGETIHLNILKQKMLYFYDIFFRYFSYKRINPSFDSEYFYYILIKYLFNTFEVLYNKEFLTKVSLIKNLKKTTLKIKNNIITDKILVMYYLFVITEEYKLNYKMLDLLKHIDKNFSSNFKYEDYSLEKDSKNNRLLIKQKEKIVFSIDNLDYYRFNEDDIIDIIEKKKFNKYQGLYSLKGYLLNYEIKKDIGDKYWEEFLSSNIVEEIMKKYYSKFDCKIFKEKEVINMFKENSFYHPIFNDGFNELTQKELFLFYFSSSVSINEKMFRQCKVLIKMPKYAFFKIRLQHEFFHGSQAYLFFVFPENNIFDSPKRDLTLMNDINKDENHEKKNNDNSISINFDNIKKKKDISIEKKDEKKKIIFIEKPIQHKGGGEVIELLLYNRIVDTLNLKESIYILTKKNYNKDINKFREDFININQKSINDLLKEGRENNSDSLFSEAFAEYTKLLDNEKKRLGDYQWKSKECPDIDLDNYIFESIRNDHSKYKH